MQRLGATVGYQGTGQGQEQQVQREEFSGQTRVGRAKRVGEREQRCGLGDGSRREDVASSRHAAAPCPTMVYASRTEEKTMMRVCVLLSACF